MKQIFTLRVGRTDADEIGVTEIELPDDRYELIGLVVILDGLMGHLKDTLQGTADA